MKRISALAVIFAASLWGVDGVALRPELYSLPVALVVLLESGIAAAYMTPFFVKKLKSLSSFNIGDWLSFGGVAFFGGAIGTLAITQALFYVGFVNLSIVILIQKLQPVIAIFLAAIFLKERPKKIFYFWAALALIGAYFMTFGFSLPVINPGDKTVLAAGFAFLAAFSFATSTVLSKRALKNVSFEFGSYLRFAFTVIILLAFVLASGNFSSLPEITGRQWIIFLIIAFTTGGPAIFLYYYGLKNISASTATICELAFPLTAVILEYFIRGNILSWVQWIGAAALLLSILKATDVQRRSYVERKAKLIND